MKGVIFKLIEKSETTLPKDIKYALYNALNKETNPIAKKQLKIMLCNIALAEKKRVPFCQDTGNLIFYVELPFNSFWNFDIEKSIRRAVAHATKKIPLRANIVNPFTRTNTGNNIGVGAPVIHYKMSKKDYLKITCVAKGAGSENMSALSMLSPTDEIEEIKNFVIEKVIQMDGKPCPPYIVGIGIGGTSERCMELAKFASLRNLNKRNKNERIALLEKSLLREVNSLGIGVMGLGGDTTSLGVNIEYADTHTGSLPIALNIQCWAVRRASVRMFSNGKIEWF